MVKIRIYYIKTEVVFKRNDNSTFDYWSKVKYNFIKFFNKIMNENTKRIIKFNNLVIENDDIDFSVDILYFGKNIVMEIDLNYSFSLVDSCMILESITHLTNY